MTVLTRSNAAPVRRMRYLGAALVAALAGGMLIATPAAAAGDPAFATSFETADAAPVLRGTGEAVNLTGDRLAPGSLLGHVAEATASAENPPNETVANLADGLASSKWLAFAKTAWVQYELSEPQSVSRYTLTSGDDASERDPKDFRLQGSNDASTWTALDTQTGQSFAGRGETTSYPLSAPSEAYQYYRLDITANQSGDLIQLAGWELIGDDSAGAQPSDVAVAIGSGPKSSSTAKTGVGFSGVQALQYSGRHLDAGAASSTNVLYEDLDIAVAADTALSYLIFPELDAEQTYAATFAAVDVRFSDGSTLSTIGATDSYGYGASAREHGQANVLWPDQWNRVTVDLGAAEGKTVTDILFVYDHPGDDVKNIEVPTAETAFSGWVDDIDISAATPRDTEDGLVSYVDTRRGTNSTGGFSRGNNLPATAWPNGFNFITPMTNADNTGTLYHYQRSNTSDNLPALNGIGFSHEPSIWMGDRNQLAVLPAANANPTSTLNDRRLTFHRENEIARPDIYSVGFDNGIDTEVTATDHGAIYRFTFTEDASSILIDQLVDSSNLKIEGSTVSGWVDGGSGYPGRTRMFVYGTFDADPGATGPTTVGDRNGSARFAAFDTSSDKTVELSIASSFISQDQAAKNHSLELDGVSFDQAHAAVRDAWNERLSVVHDVEGATDTQLATLYSSLYRLNLYPNSQFENTGSSDAPDYKYASPVSDTTGDASDTQTNAEIVDGKVYVNNGFWDTYRTAWPLYSLLYPDVTEDLVDGFVQQYRDGGWVARWSSPGYADLMTGTSSDVAFAEAYLAGSLDTDTALEAYDAALKNATVLPTSNAVGRKGLAESIFLGYTQSGTHESASWGLEGFINDFGIAEMAKALAEDPETPAERVDALKEEAVYFEARAQHYVEMYNPDAGTFTARNTDGSWPDGADFDKKAWGGAFTEASAWTFGYHAPHDVDGLAALYGGRQGLLENMHQFLTEREKADHSGIHEAREARDVRLGMLGMSNQIAHHIPYVLAEAGDPSGAQALIRDIQQRLFVGSDIGQGYPGDEDNGEFSAWYVFSALGFYPLEVGSGDYTIGSPLFDSATVSLPGGDLVVTAPGASDGAKYVAGVQIDGEEITETTFDGDLLRDGGHLDFAMSDEPSTWGAKDLDEQLDVPTSLVDATKPGRGKTTAADGTAVGALVDDTMNSSVDFDGGSADIVWTSQSGPVAVSQYTLTSTDVASAPKSWTLSGSVDGKNWVALDSREDEAFRWDTQTRPFGIETDGGAFTSFRLEIQAADGAALSLAELELFATAASAEELSASGAADQRVEVDSAFAGPVATIVGTEEEADGYEVSVDYGDGEKVDEVVLTRTELGGWQVTAPHTFTAPGAYTATVTVRDSNGAMATASTNISVFRDETFTGALNSVCIGDLGVTAADCDAQGHGYFRDKLADDGFVQGETLAVPGTELTYDLPAVEPGAADNVTGDGQSFRIDLGEGATQISFIGTATESAREPQAVLHFVDGSTQNVPISFGDWVGASGSPAFGNTVLAVSEGRLSGTGAESSVKNTAIYATAPLDLAKNDDGTPKIVESITMPTEPGDAGDGRVHVFAVASDGDREASAPLAVEAAEVGGQVTGIEFEETLATATGGENLADATAVINWGDGTDVITAPVVDGTVIGGHSYEVAGDYDVRVTVDDGLRSAAASVTIAVSDPEPEFEPTIQVTPEEVEPGDEITVTGDGFAPDESVEVRFAGSAQTVEASADGRISATLVVPDDAVDGEYPITALGDVSNVEAKTAVTVTGAHSGAEGTTVSLAPAAEAPVVGELFTLTAAVDPAEAAGRVDFVEGEAVLGSAPATGGTASADVRFDTSGEHVVTARFVPDDPEAYEPSTSEAVVYDVRSAPVLDAEVTLSASTVVQGGTIEVTGRGFASGEQIALELHSDPVKLATVTADASGVFRAQVTIPVSTDPGEHSLVAAGATSGLTAQAALTVEAAASVDGGGGGLATTGAAVPVALILVMLVLLAAGGVFIRHRRHAAQ